MSEEEQRFSEALQLPVPPADIRNAVLTDLQTAGDFVQRLGAEDWKIASAVPGWTLGDVVAHLNLGLSAFQPADRSGGGGQNRQRSPASKQVSLART